MVTEREELTRHERELAEREQELTEAHATIARVTPRVENLRLVVQGLRGLLGVEQEHEGIAATEHVGRATRNGAASKLTYGGRASIPAVIFDVLDERETGLGDIIARVGAHGAFEDRKKPSRGSITNRLNEMAERGEIVKVRRGVYKSLPSHGGPENPDERGGPNPAVQLDREKPPDEEMVLPRLGHPYGEGSTKVVSRL